MPVFSFSCFQTRSQRQHKTFVLWALESKGLCVRVSPFTDSFQDSCSRVVTSYARMALVAAPPIGRKLGMRTLSWSIQVLASGPWQMLDQTQVVPSFFYQHCQDWVAGWQMWCLGRRKETWTSWKPCSVLGPETARPLRRSPFLTVDSCSSFNLWASYPPDHSLCGSGEHPHPICSQQSLLSLNLFGFCVFLIPFQV